METLLITTNSNGVYLWVLDNPLKKGTELVEHKEQFATKIDEQEEKIKMREKEVTISSIQYVLHRENYIFVSLIWLQLT